MSIRADVTFIRTFARAPERISPVHVVAGAEPSRSAAPSVVSSIRTWSSLRVCALDHVDELRERRLVVGAVHREHRVVAEEGPHRLDQRIDRVAELVRRDQRVRGVAVAGRKVLGTHRRAVGAAPLEHVVIDRGRDAAPHDGVVEPVRAQDLRHLGDVPEHVRQVADAHLAAELARAGEPLLEVPPDRLAGDEELVHQHLPRPIASRPASTSVRNRCSFSGRISR